MTRVSGLRAAGLLVVTAVLAAGLTAADNPPRRDAAAKAMQAGNFKDAYEAYRKLALNPADDPRQVGDDLQKAVLCLQQLGRSGETDDFREQVIAAHKKNWRLLEAAANSYTNCEHYGYVVAGKFSRGFRRGGETYVGTFARDRVRALQLMQQALAQTAPETDKAALARFHLQFAQLLLAGAGRHEPWRLQYLTDLAKLPDFEEASYWRYGGETQGAPVDADGNPVYYRVPESYETSANDGERWRWHLAQAAEFAPTLTGDVDMTLARFLREQFDVPTLAAYGGWSGGEDDKNKKEGTFTIHTLGDDETIARLATGIKRFKLPDEFNWIKICERVAARGRSPAGKQARDLLATVYEDRRQYPKAAAAWKKAIAEYGPGLNNNSRKARLEQIVGNWGRFEPGQTQPAGTKAGVDFRYRNGNKVSFEARAVKVSLLLDDVKAYLKDHTGQLDWDVTQIENLGYRLVERGENRYLGEKVAAWDVELTPRPDHVDGRITVTTPMIKPGAYLLTATMADGNVSRIIVWLSDTVLLKKPLDGKVYCFVGDAVDGKPVPKASVECFGWKQVQTVPNRNEWKVVTTSFLATTDADGQLLVDSDRMSHEYQWLITARTQGEKGNEGRFAYLGFTGVWYGQRYDAEYNATKVFTITDRPVYRPGQTMQFKSWVRHAKYDQANTSSFAHQQFTVRINDPKGEKIFEKAYTSDEYGGLAGEFPLPSGCTLGSYGIFLPGVAGSGSNFRVEEYKKPEFEVTVDAPPEPISPGERVGATIKAKYYFGAPVTKAKVKYKVLRTSHADNWYPRGAWDWFYGKGYWWFAADYAWYPGWSEWGCRRPIPPWWGGSHEQPEVVLENEVDIGTDGTVKVVLDTLPAKELHGNQDHQYSITAEVVDESRRRIVGTGNVLVARKPFKVFARVDRGYYHSGDVVNAGLHAQTLDGKPVEGKGELTLYKISYNDKGEPAEKAVEIWKLDTDARGEAHQEIKAARPGQFRLSYKLTDKKHHTIEGGYVFVVRGEGFDGKDYRFNDLELVTDKREYAPGEKVRLQVNANRADAAVLLFTRPTNGVYLPPKVVRLHGKSTVEEIAVAQKDMPNFFVEAVTVADGRVYTELREVIVPPEKRVVNVEVLPSQPEYKPGQKATVKLKLTDFFGKPFVGSTVVSVYDKSVEYISGGSNVPEIKEFFWKWRRRHHPNTESSLAHWLGNLAKSGEVGMSDLGVFGGEVIEELQKADKRAFRRQEGRAVREMDGTELRGHFAVGIGGGAPSAPPAMAKGMGDVGVRDGFVTGVQIILADRDEPANGPTPAMPEPTVRKNFADTAFWAASLTTGADGVAEVSLTMPENLTGWKVKVWAMGHGTKVGQGEAEVTTKKDLLVRLQAPRFFVEKDEVVLSANVHNYLKSAKAVRTSLELDGGTLVSLAEPVQTVQVDASGERRVDWRVRVKGEGEAVVRVKAVTDEESDAMEMRFPCYVHGMLKTDSFAGALRPEDEIGKVTFNVPAERRVNESRLEVRYSPTLAGAMVDALPYLADYPYGCTEQTLNRFVPTVITQRILQDMKLDLKAIKEKRTNLNAQEIGDARERAKGWQRFPRNPVFDEAEVRSMAAAGVQALAGMQCSDGGWGWFSGYGEHSWPHTTAVVVHGLQLARHNGVALPAGMLERGVAWLKNYRSGQLALLRNAPERTQPYKEFADNLDALVQMVLADAGEPDDAMRDFLYRDRTHLAVYGKCMLGLTLDPKKDGERLAMVLKNVEQFVVQDDENQTAYLRLPADNAWWNWYGSEIESQAYYLKLLSRTSPKAPTASRLVKYLLNNRKNATYWTSTRDTATCIEALAEYLKASGEDRPDMTVEVWLDGKKHKEVKIDASNVFTFDNSFLLIGDAVESGKHVLEIRKHGTGPVYFNAYLTNFTLEDFITHAGLEVKVDRKYYRLKKVEHTVKVQGARGQAADQKVEKYEREELANLATLKSGDLVEVELTIDSKNDYEYLIFEDPKAAGFEPELVRSGYTPNGPGAYMELRDDRVCFFVRALTRGQHSVSYRLRAEVPGKFSALPARASAMYAPELKGNSDEIKLAITD